MFSPHWFILKLKSSEVALCFFFTFGIDYQVDSWAQFLLFSVPTADMEDWFCQVILKTRTIKISSARLLEIAIS